ncbi:3-oxoacyl-[acyl-carrier-protein] reductase FabG [Mycobacterium basiliense]|uniref:3-oxoacyl-[acyl-carrier-protein] reductase FabG n=1 Tax=Mycobacterium basiliense TaxID=2094119 RepID=A0A447GGF4_9MYCO|nr:SDR family NAD(P)-dependent oxidoreductase [Mycobacterium basiliense]VDM89545.1 3-oxoacyl-[acyl-carrier-protein] reductase FabG [Mycobacterium basiliense]
MSETAKVAVVTGASRGAGRGIAAALGARGWRVYATGRGSIVPPPGGVAVRVDHADDHAVAALFEQVQRESGRLDLLVNNAASMSEDLIGAKPFWRKPLALADILDVGLRSSYVAAWYAAPLLIAQDRGLIAFTSSPGSVCYMHGPAYGAQKAATDKMAADMAVDFRGTGVATVSVWMGIVLTEKLISAFDAISEGPQRDAALAKTAQHAETPEFTGHVIDALFHDPSLGQLSGLTLIGAELAERYGITDEGGRRPPSHRAMLGAPRTPSTVVVR